MEQHKNLIYVGAFTIPIVVSIVVAQVTHVLGTKESDQVWFYPGLVVGVLIGVACLLSIPFQTAKAKYVSCLIYLPVMLGVSWLAGFTTFFINSEFCC